MQFRLVFFICSNLIEFGKAKISIFRCQHALPIKMQTVFVAASISNQIWMRFSGKHLNYFRRNVSILNLCFESRNVHLFRLTCVRHYLHSSFETAERQLRFLFFCAALARDDARVATCMRKVNKSLESKRETAAETLPLNTFKIQNKHKVFDGDFVHFGHFDWSIRTFGLLFVRCTITITITIRSIGVVCMWCKSNSSKKQTSRHSQRHHIESKLFTK